MRIELSIVMIEMKNIKRNCFSFKIFTSRSVRKLCIKRGSNRFAIVTISIAEI